MLSFNLKSFFDLLKQNKVLSTFIVFLMLAGIVLMQPSSKAKINKPVFIQLCHSTNVDSIIAVKDTIVLPVLYKKIPNLKDVHYKVRMKKFIDMMLPSVLLAREKIIQERHKIIELNAAIVSGIASRQDSMYVDRMKKNFKANKVDELLRRLHPHPVSIVLAQAAIESGWGTSRFCREANNIYGIWSYTSSEKRIKAGESRSGTSIYLRKYDSIFESVYDYYTTIAKANAYKEFREARLYSDNPYRLIWYLSNYSEMRYEYVRSLRNVIEFNDLHQYDEYKLARINKNDDIWNSLIK